MAPTTNAQFSYSPGIRALLPLFYVAWVDRVLTPSEIGLLRQQVAHCSFLSEEDRQLVDRWIDPAKPPSAQLFKFWDIILREAAAVLPPGKRNLTDLGLSIAGNSNIPPSELAYFESQLKSIDVSTYQHLFSIAEEESDTVVARKTSVSVQELQVLLDGSQAELRHQMRILLADDAFQLQTLRDKEAYRQQVLQWVKLLAQQGHGALAFPVANGGKDDMGAYATVFEMLGYHDLSLTIKFGVQFGLFGGSIHQLGTKKHHDKYLEAIGKGELLGCFAMTETGHGSNVRGLETTATYLPETEQFLIHSPNRQAGKEYIGNALHGRLATVFAQLIVGGENHGVHALLVPLRDEAGKLLPGIEVEDCGYKLGLNGVDNGRIWFHQVLIPRDNLLDRLGFIDEQGKYSSAIENPSKRFFSMLGTLVGGRVCVPRAGISAAKTGLCIAIKYALRRRQFGPTLTEPETLLLDYPSHQRRLMPLLAKTYALHFALLALSERYVNRKEAEMQEIETLAAALKAYSTWHTTTTLQECREACGGKGYLAENRFADLKADTDIFTTFEGDNTVLLQLVAKGVLTAFRKAFNEEGNLALLRYLGDRISTAVTELNPFIIRNTSREHLLDTDFHLSAFRYRESTLVSTTAQQMRNLIKSGHSAYDAGIACQTQLLQLALAYAEKTVLEYFYQAIQSITDAPLQQLMKQLAALYALKAIESDKGWFLENDYLSDLKSRAITKLIDELCLDTRQHAALLVAAFAIPDSCLAAPIALCAL
ncbi:MAG TPA: acyl-CoA dehydrogenase [Saprospiraceae bacterium]|nr:acyl-CoA dehydrogenase [Saprospiraceae bacterium]HMQ83962.1 acyl-CoA dehydrogenase [Saprospiraceae bacterium]